MDNVKNLLFIFINIGDIPLGRGELGGDERLLIFLVPYSAPAAYQVQPKIIYHLEDNQTSTCFEITLHRVSTLYCTYIGTTQQYEYEGTEGVDQRDQRGVAPADC